MSSACLPLDRRPKCALDCAAVHQMWLRLLIGPAHHGPKYIMEVLPTAAPVCVAAELRRERDRQGWCCYGRRAAWVLAVRELHGFHSRDSNYSLGNASSSLLLSYVIDWRFCTDQHGSSLHFLDGLKRPKTCCCLQLTVLFGILPPLLGPVLLHLRTWGPCL